VAGSSIKSKGPWITIATNTIMDSGMGRCR
jgi:hypothetical protein